MTNKMSRLEPRTQLFRQMNGSLDHDLHRGSQGPQTGFGPRVCRGGDDFGCLKP